VALLGGIMLMVAIGLQIIQIIASFMQKRQLVDNTGDPWDGRSLEWSTPSPAPFYNFINIPQVSSRDAFLTMKQTGIAKPVYEDIHMPKNISLGIYIAGLAFLLGFGFIWGITWLIIASLVGIIVCIVLRTFDEETEYVLTADEVEKLEKARIQKAVSKLKHISPNQDEDMGLREFIKVVLVWALDFIKNKRWRTI
jgi:cytochrome o ubiquinol oxidase subunit 1